MAIKKVMWIVFILIFTLIEGLLICSVARGAILYSSFNSGELSPLMKYRIDTDKRYMGVETMQNFLVKPQGVAIRRPGTKYIGTSEMPGEEALPG